MPGTMSGRPVWIYGAARTYVYAIQIREYEIIYESNPLLMLFSKSCEYGLRAVLYLVAQNEEEYVSIKKISGDLDIPYHFVTKTLQKLTERGLLTSYRGPKGGVKLARPADQISIKEIVETIDGKDLFTECILGLPECGNQKPCPLHNEWADVRGRLGDILETATVEEMARKAQSKDIHLTSVLEANNF